MNSTNATRVDPGDTEVRRKKWLGVCRLRVSESPVTRKTRQFCVSEILVPRTDSNVKLCIFCHQIYPNIPF